MIFILCQIKVWKYLWIEN